MALIDQIELLGSSVEADIIGHDEAAHLLVEYSDGGLTRLGALDALDQHRSMQSRYEKCARRSLLPDVDE